MNIILLTNKFCFSGQFYNREVILEPAICYTCSSKICEKSDSNVLSFCNYGVAYYNHGDQIEKKEERTTLRDISNNLRHELHKVIQTIVVEATEIDPTLSIKTIDLDNPASRIIGATIILDQFIEMITGVHSFHPDIGAAQNQKKKTNLYAIIQKYVNIFSLIKNTRRAKEFKIQIDCDQAIISSLSSNILEYILSILIDNVWKYSLDNTEGKILVEYSEKNLINCKIINISPILDDPKTIFEKGYQGLKTSEGFGYGLYWLTLLVSYYNRVGEKSEIDSNPLKIQHTQNIINDTMAEQIFTLRNIRYET